ncbi:MAG: SGNH/GDSL hydrolase family protein [Clostridia bacterium]|nr:SGNH/GDSL hydrolase family protein [Clostridia bacterium]
MEKLIEKFKQNEDVTIEFVGDSITHGLNHCRPEETYVAKFAMLLAKRLKNYSVFRYDGVVLDEQSPMKGFDGPILVSYKENSGKIDVIKNGIGGNTVQRAINRMDDFTNILANGKAPDVIFMMFGINDALKSDPKKYVDAETYRSNYNRLIEEVQKRNPDAQIILMLATTNDQSIEEHVRRSQELAEEKGLPYIDLHRLWTEHYDAEADHFGHGDWLANNKDACHPTPKAAHIMAETILDEFLKMIYSE